MVNITTVKTVGYQRHSAGMRWKKDPDGVLDWQNKYCCCVHVTKSSMWISLNLIQNSYDSPYINWTNYPKIHIETQKTQNIQCSCDQNEQGERFEAHIPLFYILDLSYWSTSEFTHSEFHSSKWIVCLRY